MAFFIFDMAHQNVVDDTASNVNITSTMKAQSIHIYLWLVATRVCL